MRRAAVLGLMLLAAHLGAWESTRVHVNADGSLTYTADAEGNRIPDFGWVGYQEGCKAIPNVPVKKTLGPVAGDNTSSINAALDAVAAMPLQADGTRGALLLLPGTYNVSGIIRVGASGVVLRGSGNGTDPATSTIIVGTSTAFDATTGRGEYGVIRVGLSGLSGAGFVGLAGTQVDVTDAFNGPGDDTLTVSDVAPFKAGDWAVIKHPVTDLWLAAVNYGDTATAPPWTSSYGPIVQSRRIRAVDTANKRLTLAGGLFQPLRRSLSQATVAKADMGRFIFEAGVEDLRVDIVHSSPTDEHHAKNAVELSRLINGWARRVRARYYWHSAVVVSNAAQVTVRDCEGSDMAGIITGERGYTFSAEAHSNNILFTKDIARDGRHNYISCASFSSNGIVFHDSESWHGQGSAYMEGHMLWSVGLLFDNVRHLSAQTGQALGLYNRGDYGTNHGWSAAHSVAWNVNVGTADIIVQKPPTAQNYAIGCFGDQITGVKPPAPFSHPTGYVEGSKTAGLSPASLYLAQLAAKTCPGPPASPTPTSSPTRTGTPSATRTRSPTPSATRSASPSATPTRSATGTPTASRTATASPSATRSATLSATQSATPSATPSSTRTVTLSATPTASPTRSATAADTPSASPTSTVTASATLTRASTGTPTVSASVTESVTETPTPTGTPSATLTRIATGTGTPTATSTVTGSVTVPPTRSGTPSATLTRTPTLQPPSSATVTLSATLTATPVLSSTPGDAASLTGPLLLEQVRAVPNPVRSGRLELKLLTQGPGDTLALRLYSSARVCVLEARLPGPAGPGWSGAGLDLGPLPPGLYHLRAHLEQGSRRSGPVIVNVWIGP